MFPAAVDGARISLREWRAGDAEAFHRWIGDPEVTWFLTWGPHGPHQSREELAEILYEQARADRSKYFLAIENVSTGCVIGDTGFTWIAPQIAEIGYFLEPDYWGMGLGQEAAKMIIGLASGLGARHIIATCHADNRRSERVMQACGMTAVAPPKSGLLRYRLVVG